MPRESTKQRRTANACNACRQSKIKCSGEEPCANCQRRLVSCHFDDSPNKVVVSRQYLRDLRKRAEMNSPRLGYLPTPAGQGSAHTVQMSDTDPHDSGTLASSQHDYPSAEPSLASQPHTEHVLAEQNPRVHMKIWTNPFSSPSKIIRNPDKNSRKWLWLAPWSTWSFTVRLTLMLMEDLQHGDTDMASASQTGTIYPMTWTAIPENEVIDFGGLPSIDHAIYLFNTAKFHLGQHYRFFTDASFEAQIHAFYHGDSRSRGETSRVWFAQFLIILAFGTAFLSKSRHPDEAPGSKYFVRAMSLMPNTTSLWKEALLASETLALVGLYFYSTNHRESGLLYIGQALRIAQLEGLHTQLPEAELGRDTVKRCRSLWSTLWIMDRHVSTSLGLPMSTADCNSWSIPGQPTMDPDEDTVLTLQAKLSQLNWEILNQLYKDDHSPIGVFLEKTASILHTLAGHAQEIEQIIALKFGSSFEALLKGTRHITLLYHQCVMVATRPLLLSVLKERLEKLNGGRDNPDNFANFLALTTTLISTGINSAIKTLQILSREETLLASFLPFDLEFTHGAGLHLIMAQALFPHSEEDTGDVQQAKIILDEMISKGSKVAEVRKTELNRLEQLCGEFTTESERQGIQTLKLAQPESHGSDRGVAEQRQQDGFVERGVGEQVATSSLPDYSPQTAQNHQNMLENSAFMDDIGISSDAFFLMADQMAEMGEPDFVMPDLGGFLARSPHDIH